MPQENQTQRILYIWPIFTFCSFCGLTHQRLFPCSHFPLSNEQTCIFPPIRWTNLHDFCAIETSCLLSLNSHYPYHSTYPWPCWDNSNYNYSLPNSWGTTVTTAPLQPFHNMGNLHKLSECRKKKSNSRKHKLRENFHDFHMRGMFCRVT